MDIKSREARSRNMAKIRSRNTGPEMYIRSLLFREGLRYRVNYAAVEGKPDLYFPKYRVAVFIHGCFWHRHEGCKYAYTPKSNMEFWNRKFKVNTERDKTVARVLSEEGIRVIVIWECEIKAMRKDPGLEAEIRGNLICRIRESTDLNIKPHCRP